MGGADVAVAYSPLPEQPKVTGQPDVELPAAAALKERADGPATEGELEEDEDGELEEREEGGSREDISALDEELFGPD
jgi:hypothetical protein